MKTCPSCNNMLNNNVSICPYCGRNVIGITEYDYGLGVKGQVVDENMSNEGIADKIYDKNKGIRNVEDEEFEGAIELQHNINFRKNVGIFISLFFLVALIAKISTYKLLFSSENKLYIFLIPLLYSTLIFLTIYLKVIVRIKIIIIIILSIAFTGTYWHYANIFQFNFINILFEPLNIAVIAVFITSSFLKYKKIKFLAMLASSSFIMYQYFIYLKSINIELINIIFLMKISVLFIAGIYLALFLLYDFIFFNKK